MSHPAAGKPAEGQPDGANGKGKQRWQWWHTAGVLILPAGIILVGLLVRPTQAFIATMALLLAFGFVCGQGITGLWRGLLIDDRNKMSLSRLQLTLWTVVILSGLVTAALSNVAAGFEHPLDITIPEELLLLMGISTTSLVASPLIRSNKRIGPRAQEQLAENIGNLAEQEGVDTNEVTERLREPRGVEVGNRSPRHARWSDLFRGEEAGNAAHLDLGKVQNFYFTLILVISYAVVLATEFGIGAGVLEMPALSVGAVTMLGISHAGYLTYKATPHTSRQAGQPGSPTPTQPDAAARREQGSLEHPETEPTE